MEQFAATLQIKTVDVPQRLIVGLAAAHNNTDRVRDIVDYGASAKATARLSSPSEVAVFVGHNSAMLPVGIPQKIEATPAGLYTETYILRGAAGDNLLEVARDLAEHGQSLGMSIGYKTRDSRSERHGTKSVRRLLDYELKEYSFAASQAIANPMALVSAIKQASGAGRRASDWGTRMRYSVEQLGSRYVVQASAEAPDGTDDAEEQATLVGTYPSADLAQAVADALRTHVGDGLPGDSFERDDSAAEVEQQADGPDKADDKQAALSHTVTVKAKWSAADVNDLNDSCFLYVEDGEKDDEGKTVPRSKRHFPYKDSSGQVDLAHLGNAIARIPESDLADDLKARVQARARRLLAAVQDGDLSGKTITDDPCWQSGAALDLCGLGYRLLDASQQLATELKALALLGEETKDYRCIREPLRSNLRGIVAEMGRLLDFADAAERGEDGQQRIAFYKRQLALSEI